jgi:hypothetical protein
MSGDLRVLAEELDQTGGRQRDIGEAFGAAERLTDGATQRVGFSHGIVCAPSIAALAAVQASRAAATRSVQSVSGQLADNLGTASAEYTATDRYGREELNSQVPPR